MWQVIITEIWIVQKKYPVLSEKITNLIEMSRKKQNERIFSKGYVHTPCYLVLFDKYDQLTRFEEELVILLITDLSNLEKETVIRKILNKFSNDYHLKVIRNPREFSKKIDIVISTKVFSSINLREVIPLLIFYNELTRKDVDLIDQYLEKISFGKRRKLKESHAASSKKEQIRMR